MSFLSRARKSKTSKDQISLSLSQRRRVSHVQVPTCSVISYFLTRFPLWKNEMFYLHGPCQNMSFEHMEGFFKQNIEEGVISAPVSPGWGMSNVLISACVQEWTISCWSRCWHCCWQLALLGGNIISCVGLFDISKELVNFFFPFGQLDETIYISSTGDIVLSVELISPVLQEP